jgi:hypothetical protein
MKLTVRVRSSRDAQLVGIAARAVGMLPEELARIALYKETNSILSLLKERQSEAQLIKEEVQSASVGDIEGNTAEIRDSGSTASAALADTQAADAQG